MQSTTIWYSAKPSTIQSTIVPPTAHDQPFSTRGTPTHPPNPPSPRKIYTAPPPAYNTCLPARAPASTILCLCRAMQSTSEHDHPVFSKTITSKATVVYAAYMTSISAPVDLRPRSTEPAANEGKCIQHPPLCVQYFPARPCPGTILCSCRPRPSGCYGHA